MPEPPKDQSPCTVELCPNCHCEMWVSENKKLLRKKYEFCIAYCGECVVRSQVLQGIKEDEISIQQVTDFT